MKLTCPSCGAVASLEAWDNDARWRELMQVLTSLPAPLPPAVLPYLSLFRPEKSALTARKALRLAKEIADLVAQGHIQVQGKVARPCPPRIWAIGMEQMTERRGSLSLPLKTHNYLRQIVWQLADAEDAQQERAQNDIALRGDHRGRQSSCEHTGMSEIMRRYNQKYGDPGAVHE